MLRATKKFSPSIMARSRKTNDTGKIMPLPEVRQVIYFSARLCKRRCRGDQDFLPAGKIPTLFALRGNFEA